MNTNKVTGNGNDGIRDNTERLATSAEYVEAALVFTDASTPGEVYEYAKAHNFDVIAFFAAVFRHIFGPEGWSFNAVEA
jgi:hypothetical protein